MQITVDEPLASPRHPKVAPDAQYEKALFTRKLIELGLADGFTDHVMVRLGGRVLSRTTRGVAATHAPGEPRSAARVRTRIVEGIVTLAKSNYEIEYLPGHELSERLIFPYGPPRARHRRRPVCRVSKKRTGGVQYYATYSAYDGKVVLPQLLETDDFLRFKMHTLNGPAVANKGFALFPRRVNGRYAMLSRQDGENLFLMYSDNLYFWHDEAGRLEADVPLGVSCRSGIAGRPSKPRRGWLVLSHGVGPMRKYSIGAFLLDLQRPDCASSAGSAQPLADPRRERTRGLRSQRGLQLRCCRPQRRTRPPLRDVRLRLELRDDPPRRTALCDGSGLVVPEVNMPQGSEFNRCIAVRICYGVSGSAWKVEWVGFQPSRCATTSSSAPVNSKGCV